MAKRISGGSTRNKSDSAGRRLGFKVFPTQYVKEGGIIIRQKGNLWYPGENVTQGRDHTLNADKSGIVRSRTVKDKKPKGRLRKEVYVESDSIIL